MSPRGERFLKPSPSASERLNPAYFIGIDTVTRREQIFFQDGNGDIVRAFRKFVGNTEALRRFNIRTTWGRNGEEIFSFDVDGGGRGAVRRLEFLPRQPVGEGRDLREYVEDDNDGMIVRAAGRDDPFW